MAEYFRPDMLTGDVVMPGLSGIDAAIRIGEMLPSCEILLFSGHAKTLDLLKQAHVSHDFAILASLYIRATCWRDSVVPLSLASTTLLRALIP